MEVDSPEESVSNPQSLSKEPSTKFTPSERITDLNQIDTSISTLLSSASTAISILSNTQDNTTNKALQSPTLESAKSTFTTAASIYFSTLSTIEVRLRRQVYALEEAGLITTGTEQDVRRGRNLNNSINGDVEGSGRIGGGPLDPSWLNARSSDAVEVGKKRELLDQAMIFLEEVKMNGGGKKEKNGVAVGHEDADADMGVGSVDLNMEDRR